jgi:endonuclease-3
MHGTLSVTLPSSDVFGCQNTSGHNSKRALHLLRSHYPEGYAAILDKPVDTLEEVLRPVGLSHVKSRRIYRMLVRFPYPFLISCLALSSMLALQTEIRERTSGLDLDFLRDLPASDARTWLARLHGLGSKSVGCIMAFTLGHAELPVDTHVWRVSRRLSVGGLIRPEASRERVYEALRDAVPDVLKRELHMLLVRHGMQVCKPRAPRCDACALRPQCAAAAAAAAGNAGAEHKHSEEKSACKRSRAHEFEW